MSDPPTGRLEISHSKMLALFNIGGGLFAAFIVLGVIFNVPDAGFFPWVFLLGTLGYSTWGVIKLCSTRPAVIVDSEGIQQGYEFARWDEVVEFVWEKRGPTPIVYIDLTMTDGRQIRITLQEMTIHPYKALEMIQEYANHYWQGDLPSE